MVLFDPENFLPLRPRSRPLSGVSAKSLEIETGVAGRDSGKGEEGTRGCGAIGFVGGVVVWGKKRREVRTI